MYQSINTKTGVQSVLDWIGLGPVESGPDGLTFTPPDSSALPGDLIIPDRLWNWLMGLRLLKNMPLTYLVPEEELLPVESIRFFHIDPTWVDRVLDGVFSAVDTGTVDLTFSATMLALAREKLDEGLVKAAKAKVSDSTWAPSDGLTGILIRSELVRRWPDMVVQAYSTPDRGAARTGDVPVLRAEAISKDVFIAVIAGTPELVTVEEPHVGLRYGVEPDNETSSAPPYHTPKRNPDGTFVANQNIKVKISAERTIDIGDFAPKAGGSARMVGIQLERLPYVQFFQSTHPEDKGSADPPPDFRIQLRNGRFATLSTLESRVAMQALLEKP